MMSILVVMILVKAMAVVRAWHCRYGNGGGGRGGGGDGEFCVMVARSWWCLKCELPSNFFLATSLDPINCDIDKTDTAAQSVRITSDLSAFHLHLTPIRPPHPIIPPRKLIKVFRIDDGRKLRIHKLRLQCF